MELRLELALSTTTPGQCSDPNQKRDFGNALLGFEENDDDVPQTLPLLTWDVCNNHKSSIFNNRNGEGEDDNFAVGWPPVKSWRKQFCYQNRGGCAANYVNVENGGGGGGGGRRSNSKYVKVKMEGVGIARKIDLSIHRSYQTLAPKLMPLFGKCEENVEEYKLTYQDKEGDWLLARDVPWATFIESVQRLKLQKNGH